MDLGNIIETCNANVGGTGTTLYYAPVSYFDTLVKPTAESAATTADEIVTIGTAHTFNVGKGFHAMEVLIDTGGIESNSVGEIGGKSFDHSCKGMIINNSPLNAGLLSKLASCKWIFLVPETTSDGVVYRQIGSEIRAAYCEENNYTSGQSSTDKRGTSVAFKSTGHATHAPFYTGVVELHP